MDECIEGWKNGGWIDGWRDKRPGLRGCTVKEVRSQHWSHEKSVQEAMLHSTKPPTPEEALGVVRS